MPKKKCIPSLEKLCLENVATNAEHIWAKDDRVNCLAGSLVQALLQLMGEKKLLTSSLLCSLLLPQLKELNLIGCSDLVNQDIVHSIKASCKNLSCLLLHHCDQILPNALADLIKELPCLVKLNLSSTQCDTQVLSTVGTCCRMLRELDICDCQRLSVESLLHLAYDPSTRSFCCQMLQYLVLSSVSSETKSLDLVWALVFLLLALPRLKFLVHCFLADAVILIYNWEFESVWMPYGFPSLEEVARCRMPSHPNGQRFSLTLELKEIYSVYESFLPKVCSVCPDLSAVSVILTDSPGIGQNFLSGCHITQLTLGCQGKKDMRELLPVVARLRNQLQSLFISDFSFQDEFSFHVLLSHCVKFQKLRIHFLSPEWPCHNRHPDMEALDWDFSLHPKEFPQLSDFTLVHFDTANPLPSRHIILLEECLESLLKHSPCLEKLELSYLPFSLDEMFRKVLNPPGTALLSLCKLSLIEVQVSIRTIHHLLSSENQLDYINLHSCPNIDATQHKELLEKVCEEGLDVNIRWKL